MIRRLGDLKGFVLGATDAQAGHVDDALLDDETWTVRNLVVDTSKWLSPRKVMISPFSILAIEWADSRVDVDLEAQQIERSPEIDPREPILRRHELSQLGYYGHRPYWSGPHLWGSVAHPVVPVDEPQAFEDAFAHELAAARHEEAAAQTHLRGANSLQGFHVDALDGAAGEIEDLLFDEESWSIRCIVIDPRKWWPGRHHAVSPQSLERVWWPERSMVLNVTRAGIHEIAGYGRGFTLPSEDVSRLIHGGVDQRGGQRPA